MHQIVCKKPVLDPHAFFSIIPKGGLLSEYNCIQPLLSRSTIWDRVSQTHPPTRTDIRRVANIYIDLHVYKLILGLGTVQSIQMIRSIYVQGGPQKMQKLNE